MNRCHELQTAVRRELALDASRRPRRSPLLRLSVAAALLWTAGAGSATAQAPYRQELALGLSSFDVGGRSNPVLIDLDGDADLDAVLGQTQGGLTYLVNTGTASSPAFIEGIGNDNPIHGIDVGFFTNPEFADLDSDGDLDLLVGENDPELSYFENTGSSAAAFIERTGTSNPFSSLAVNFRSQPDLADLDGDGDLDLIVGAAPGNVRYFTNQGNASSPSFVERTGSANPLSGFLTGTPLSPDLADVDADGDLDAVAGDAHGLLYYLENTGSTASPSFVERTGSMNPFNGFDVEHYSAPDLADFDGDGDLDAIVGEECGNLNFYQNTATPASPAFIEKIGSANPFDGVDVGSRSHPGLADLDSDGDLDAAIGDRLGNLRFFEFSGTSAFPSFFERIGSDNPFTGIDVGLESDPSFGDFDRDGDLDAVVGAFLGDLRYFENTGSATIPAFAERTGSSNPLSSIDIGATSSPESEDLDGDGDLDLVVGEYLGKLEYLENTGTPTAPAFLWRTGAANPLGAVDVSRLSSPELVDFDSDGDLDAIVGEEEGFLHYLENTGTASAPAFVERSGSANPLHGIEVGGISSPVLADLDSDGDLDATVGELGGRLVFLRSLKSVFADGFESGTTSAWTLTIP